MPGQGIKMGRQFDEPGKGVDPQVQRYDGPDSHQQEKRAETLRQQGHAGPGSVARHRRMPGDPGAGVRIG